MQIQEQILCSIGDASKLLGIGKSKFYQMLAQNLIGPSEIILDGKKMFLVSELRAWTEAGCPSREKWQKMKEPVNE